MAGTFNAKVLAEGQLPTSKTALYTVPASTVAYVKLFDMLNTNAAQQTIIIYLNTAGTSRSYGRAILEINEFASVLSDSETIELQAGDTIEAQTTTASAVDYTITGVEET